MLISIVRVMYVPADFTSALVGMVKAGRTFLSYQAMTILKNAGFLSIAEMKLEI